MAPVTSRRASYAVVYCDGSGLPKGGPAGIGFIAFIDQAEIEGSLSLKSATNQQAEILAAAFALDQIRPCDTVIVYSDSEYVVKGMNVWMGGWRAREWRKGSGGPVRNRRYWERLLEAVSRHGTVEFGWVRGHAGVFGNERADRLAGEARAAA